MFRGEESTDTLSDQWKPERLSRSIADGKDASVTPWTEGALGSTEALELSLPPRIFDEAG